jgi:hypothetical protein
MIYETAGTERGDADDLPEDDPAFVDARPPVRFEVLIARGTLRNIHDERGRPASRGVAGLLCTRAVLRALAALATGP